MDFLTHFRSRLDWPRVQTRILALSKHSPKISPRHRKTGIGILCLVGAIVLGTLAYRSAWSSFNDDWRHNHGPSTALIRKSLPGFGVGSEQVALSTLPSDTPLSVGFWVTNDRNWVASISSHEKAPLFYCRQSSCSAVPTNPGWQNLGLGWDGFQALLQDLETYRAETSERPEERDPRAIFY